MPNSNNHTEKSSKHEYSDEDVALQFLQQTHHTKDQIVSGISDFQGTSPLPAELLWKIDLHIMPVLMITYMVMYLDAILINYAATVGIKEFLSGNQFSNVGTIYGVAFIVGEPFVSFCLQHFPVGKTLGVYVCTWGIIIASHAACHSYASLMVCRSLLGFVESACAVGLLAVSGMYYTKAEQAARIGAWCIMAGMAYVIGGLLSFAFQFVHHGVLKPWQILFLSVGAFTLLLGIVTIIIVPDNSTSAWFLSEDEKLKVVEHIRSNHTGVENKKFKLNQIKELFFKDQHTWPVLILTVISQISTGCLGYYSVTVVQTFGYSNKVSALLQMPIGVLIMVIIIIITQLISRTGAWTAVTFSMHIPSIVGAIVLVSQKHTETIGNLFGVFLLYSGSCVITNMYLWNTFNTAGYTKRVFRNAALLSAFSLATVIGPQTFQAYSAPEYQPAKISILVTQCIAAPLVLYVGWLSRRENARRDKKGVQDLPADYEFMDMTDVENPNFRYTW